MGSSKGSGSEQTQSGSTVQQRQPTAEETRLNQLDVELREATNPLTIAIQKTGLGLGNQLLSGKTPLPGWMYNLTEGIDEPTINSMVENSLRDVDARMAGYGLMDSGTRAAVEGRTSGDIRRAVAEYNIGNKLNLLNLALTGQAQIQQPGLGYSSTLGSRLQSLGATTKSYTGESRNNSGWQVF